MTLSVINGPIIAAGEAVSEAIDCSGGDLVRITMPAGWTRAPNLTVLVSTDGEGFMPICSMRAVTRSPWWSRRVRRCRCGHPAAGPGCWVRNSAAARVMRRWNRKRVQRDFRHDQLARSSLHRRVHHEKKSDSTPCSQVPTLAPVVMVDRPRSAAGAARLKMVARSSMWNPPMVTESSSVLAARSP